jgi:hypothetical protein
MVLISIRPFAVRKMILLLVALLGFSALCFADPLLMVRQHDRVHSRVAVAVSMRTVALQLTDVAAPTPAPNTTAALEKEDAPTLRDSWLCFQPDRCAVEPTGDPDSAPFWPTICGH